MNHLTYLIMAYSVVWIIIAFYVFVLISRNRRLSQQIDMLESRILDLEQKKDPRPDSPTKPDPEL